MLMPDVNVLVYAHRSDTPDHDRYRYWLGSVLGGDAAYAISDLVLSGFLRVVTHPRVFAEPTPLDAALRFVTEVRDRPNCVTANPGARHWGIFRTLCREADTKGNLVPDAFLAALAIEGGYEWITTDRDFARFPGLRWRHPLADDTTTR
jgi:uncharacterized protein